MKKSKTIKMFLAEGCQSGGFTVEIMNWTGHLIVSPRSNLHKLFNREEIHRTGLYLLFDKALGNPEKIALYVGESDNVGKRLKQHLNNSDLKTWDKVCIITSKDRNLTKSHVKYLESEIINLIYTSKNIVMLNRVTPKFDYLPESDISDMNIFLEYLYTVFPFLNIHITTPPDHNDSNVAPFTPFPKKNSLNSQFSQHR
ncbi:MAG: GIY-YIG nuclease family protein [Methylocystaceae bacterium]|nr:GIY-YIG nuclease family protein [Methylocystaceae bacterium]